MSVPNANQTQAIGGFIITSVKLDAIRDGLSTCTSSLEVIELVMANMLVLKEGAKTTPAPPTAGTLRRIIYGADNNVDVDIAHLLRARREPPEKLLAVLCGIIDPAGTLKDALSAIGEGKDHAPATPPKTEPVVESSAIAPPADPARLDALIEKFCGLETNIPKILVNVLAYTNKHHESPPLDELITLVKRHTHLKGSAQGLTYEELAELFSLTHPYHEELHSPIALAGYKKERRPLPPYGLAEPFIQTFNLDMAGTDEARQLAALFRKAQAVYDRQHNREPEEEKVRQKKRLAYTEMVREALYGEAGKLDGTERKARLKHRRHILYTNLSGGVKVTDWTRFGN